MESRMTIMNNEQETIEAAINFAKQLAPPAVILLEGELGAGKTCFVRGLCEGLGGDPRQVSSPTFSIMQEYEGVSAERLVNIDAYRLSGEDELATIGWDELLEDTNAIIAIEWPSRIKNALPSETLTIQLEHIDIQTRELLIKA